MSQLDEKLQRHDSGEGEERRAGVASERRPGKSENTGFDRCTVADLSLMNPIDARLEGILRREQQLRCGLPTLPTRVGCGQVETEAWVRSGGEGVRGGACRWHLELSPREIQAVVDDDEDW